MRKTGPGRRHARAAIPDLHPADRHRPDPRLDAPLRAVTMPDNPVTTIGKLEILHRGKELLGFHLDRLRKKPPGARTQDPSVDHRFRRADEGEQC